MTGWRENRRGREGREEVGEGGREGGGEGGGRRGWRGEGGREGVKVQLHNREGTVTCSNQSDAIRKKLECNKITFIDSSYEDLVIPRHPLRVHVFPGRLTTPGPVVSWRSTAFTRRRW